MNRVRKGKILIIIMIAVILLMDVATIITTSMLYSGMGRADLSRQSMLTGAFRLIFTGLLLYLLYRGNTIVKGILYFSSSLPELSAVSPSWQRQIFSLC